MPFDELTRPAIAKNSFGTTGRYGWPAPSTSQLEPGTERKRWNLGTRESRVIRSWGVASAGSTGAPKGAVDDLPSPGVALVCDLPTCQVRAATSRISYSVGSEATS